MAFYWYVADDLFVDEKGTLCLMGTTQNNSQTILSVRYDNYVIRLYDGDVEVYYTFP